MTTFCLRSRAHRLRVRALLASALALACLTARAAEYTVSPDGDDNAAGTREAPWRTLAKVNEALRPGDTAIFLPGNYPGGIRPARNGTPGAPITYRSATFRAARLVPGEEAELIRLDGHEHITIADFTLDAEDRINWANVTHSRHITIRGCEMRRNRRIMIVLNSSQVRLVDNVFSADRTGGDMLHLRDSSELLFEGNSTTRVGHCPLRIHRCVNVVVRANVFRCEWGRNYEFWKCGRMLIEQNIFTRARDSAGSGGACSKNLYDDSIFRQNLIFDNDYLPLCSGSYIPPGVYGTQPTGLYRGPFRAVNSRFHHNVFADNLGPAYMLSGINVSANVFQNNIFSANDQMGGRVHVDRREGISRDNRFLANLFWSLEPDRARVRYGSEHWTIEEADSKTATTSDFWSEFHANSDADPGFLAPGNRDYRPGPASKAIDAGRPLALAVGSGTGSALPVTDGIAFYDGFGIDGEAGDWIAVGSGDHLARVERVELRYYLPAILHLDREVAWEDAMPVSLPWAGEAPDAGAFEHALRHPTRLVALADPVLVPPGQPTRFSLDTLGKDIESVVWDFEDGSFAHEPAPTHRYTEAGHYGVTVRAVFSNGERGVAAVFINVEAERDPGAPLVEADFEDATRLTHWGYRFKFYRPHQTGSAQVDRADGQGKCMHIFRDAEKDNRTAAQISVENWAIDRHPRVRFQYRIPEGVPVAVELNSFPAPGTLSSFILAGTANQASRFGKLDGYILHDDGQWHEITMDVRRLRQAHPELTHLRQFMFSTVWNAAPSAAAPAIDDFEFWFDTFSILPDGG